MADEQLRVLAEAYGVATRYWDYTGVEHEVAPHILEAVLRSLDVDTDDPQSALQTKEDLIWLRALPSCVVMRQDYNYVLPVHVTDGEAVSVEIELENGGSRVLRQTDDFVAPRQVGDNIIGRAFFEIPPGLPLGWHRIVALLGEHGETAETTLAVTPARLPTPQLYGGQGWGLTVQLYSVGLTWGMGDVRDLNDLVTWSGRGGADFLLLNPLHAPEPVAPITPSPYLPMSRKFLNPQLIRPELILEAGPLIKYAKWRHLREEAESGGEYIDRNRSWSAKIKALRQVYRQPRSYYREQQFRTFKERNIGGGLADFALWSALVERYGLPLPQQFRDRNSAESEEFAQTHKQQIDFYMYLQWIASQQLKEAQAIAVGQGMRIGIMHDLAVGVHRYSADVWMNPELFATDIAVGAPPDRYNQLGQNWSQPPFRPDRLAEAAYRPIRDIMAAVGKNGGGVRIDHVMGLFRLWWIPQSAESAAEGTYVSYDYESLVGVVLLEAYRHSIALIGEDLGTVEPWVREYLKERGVMGTGVAWFEVDSDRVVAPEDYRVEQMVSVGTHDMVPSRGLLHGENVKLARDLGILKQPFAEEMAREEHHRDLLLEELRRRGMLEALPQAQAGALQEAGSADDIAVAGLYRLVCASPSRLVGLSLADAVGERCSQNQPGTDQEYPNWRVPLTDVNGERLDTADVIEQPLANAFLELMEKQIHPDR